MKGKNLIILAVVAAVLVAAALWRTRKGEEAPPDLIGKPVLSELPVNDISKLVVVSPNNTATLVRAESGWVAADRFNYPAEFSKIKETLLKLSNLKIGQIVEAEPNQRAAMKMLSPTEAGVTNKAQAGTLVDLYGPANKLVASILIGDSRHRKPKEGGPMGYGAYPDGQYISPDKGRSVYLITENLFELRDDPREWLDKELLNVSASDLTDIAITGPNRTEVHLARTNESANLDLAGLGAKEEADSAKVSSVSAGLGWLRFEDVANPALTPQQTGLDTAVVFRAVTKTGEVYTVKIGKAEDGTQNRYLRLEAAFQPVKEEPKPAAATSEKKEDEKAVADKKAAERKQIEEHVKAFNQKFGSWTYLVASYKTDALTTPRDQIAKAKVDTSTNAVPAVATSPAPSPAPAVAVAAPPSPVPPPPAPAAAGTNAPAKTEVKK